MTNILIYLYNYPNFGGIENVTTQLANWLVEHVDGLWIYSFKRHDNPELLTKLDKRIHLVRAEKWEDVNAEENRAQLRRLIEENSIKRILFQDSYAPVHHLLFSVTESMPEVEVITAEHNTPDCYLKAFKYERIHGLESIVKHALYPLWILKLKTQISSRLKWLYNRSYRYVLLAETYKPLVMSMVPEIATNSQKLTAIANATPPPETV